LNKAGVTLLKVHPNTYLKGVKKNTMKKRSYSRHSVGQGSHLGLPDITSSNHTTALFSNCCPCYNFDDNTGMIHNHVTVCILMWEGQNNNLIPRSRAHFE